MESRLSESKINITRKNIKLIQDKQQIIINELKLLDENSPGYKDKCRVLLKYEKQFIKFRDEEEKYMNVNLTVKPKLSISKLQEKRSLKSIPEEVSSEDIDAKLKYLKSICPDTSLCISFGIANNDIKEFFNFIDFKYVISIEGVGSPSTNGFVNELKYTRNNYSAYTIMKSTMSSESDNLFYEYLVGKYINKLNMIFPCFIETYGWSIYHDESYINTISKINDLDTDIDKVRNAIQLPMRDTCTSADLDKSCYAACCLTILIQHIPESKSIGYMVETDNKYISNNELIISLYHIYNALAVVANTYTHYDLHRYNVLIYEPVKGKCIHYHYINNDNTSIDFKSKYITKIIDYGRSFFVDIKNNGVCGSSMSIHKKICQSPYCRPKCGKYMGYDMLIEEEDPKNAYYICSTKRNISHDLRLLYELFSVYHKYTEINEELNNLLSKVQYGVGLEKNNTMYGTPEQVVNDNKNIIANVMDAKNALDIIVVSEKFKENNEIYTEHIEVFAEVYIYADGRPMIYKVRST